MVKSNNKQSLTEEIANAATHGIGFILSISALVLLIVFAVVQNNAYMVVGGAIFGSTLIAMYGASTLYHSFQQLDSKRIFKILDHSAIYLLIAGTYTPFVLVTLHGVWGWSLFGIIWGLAILGVYFKIFFVYKFENLSTIIYILMGWLVVIAAKPICQNLPLPGIMWLLGGGLLYTFGVVFYLWEGLFLHHSIWHLFVIAGSVCHFFAVLFYVI